MHLKKLLAVTVSSTVALMASSATAQVTDTRVNWNFDAFPGHVVNDIVIDWTGQYTGSQIYLELTQGTIHQHAAGGNTAPSSLVAPVVPNLQWDTFVTQGTEFSDTGDGVPALGGGAVNLDTLDEHPNNLGRDIPSSSTFNNMILNQQYNPSAGLIIEDETDFMVARITLSEDALGQVVFAGFASPDATNPINPNLAPRMNLPIINGVIGIPEPSTIVLLAIGLVGVVALKRRKG